MSKFRRKEFGGVRCPNGCGATFKLNFKNKPKGMAEHLEHCGGTFPLPEESMDVLKGLKTRGGESNGNRLCANE